MASARPTSSSSGEDDRYAMITDERKRKRMMSNRESARRSRMKREQHMKDLNDQVAYFTSRNHEMVMRINEIMECYQPIGSENRILSAQREELRKRLESMEMVLSYFNETTNEYSSVNNMHHQGGPWLQPWQLPVQYQPVMTSAGDTYF